jgi:amiloride-sensitive sodium channel
MLHSGQSISYPLQVTKNDYKEFQMILKNQIPKEGFKQCTLLAFLIHQPDLLPTFLSRNDFTELQYGTQLDVEITPEIIKTDMNLKKLSPNERGCYFDKEKKLKFFQIYSLQNCELECFANIIYQKCGCLPLTLPYNRAQKIPLCKSYGVYAQESCASITRASLLNSKYFSFDQNCSCLPLCDSTTYHVKYYPEYFKNDDEISITIRMNTDDMILYRRYQQFTSSDVISYVGGLLGLFAGISMLSIVEFVYFFTLRLFVNVARHLQDSKALL